ncbi:hypothetical protein [Streptomyces gilvus]|uniref:hypothetical protein n=1 Tax=Streptomyces gilvus TaxID=2920937 RepID=UPI001F0E3291|nr:hypothetical protein [Streptomyces sp. CME 23]MCH5677923.1 hypothetical protein [Streptomyces sp. CME 23]
MILPSLTLVGTFTDATGEPANGQLTLQPDAELVDTATQMVLPQVPVVVTVSNGAFSVNLLPCDAAGVTPTGWAYQVTEDFPYRVDTRTGRASSTYYIQPTGTGTVNLASLPRQTVAPTVLTYGALTGANTWTGTNVFQGEVTVPTPVNATDPTTKAYVDGHALPVAGGTLTGNLIIDVTPGAPTDSSLTDYSLFLESDYTGGENTFDSTGRLNLQSYQRAQQTNPTGSYASYGEVLRIFSRRWDSKQMIAWYGPTSYDGSGNPATADTAWFWMGAHYEANDHASVHGHWSVEVPDTAKNLQTRFEFRIWDPTTGVFGMDRTIAKFNAADVVVAQDNGAMYMAAAAGITKNLYFTDDVLVVSGASATGKRWGLQADGTAESGSNVGTDFRVNRYSDSGVFVDSPVFVKRSTGAVGIGNITAPAARLDVTEAGSRHTVEALQTTTSTISFAAYASTIGATANRYFDGRVSGDSSGRIVIFGDGKIELGDGGAGGRDVNLYRSAANKLKSDDMVIAALGLGVGNSASATAVGTLTKKIEVFDAAGASLGFVPVYATIT